MCRGTRLHPGSSSSSQLVRPCNCHIKGLLIEASSSSAAAGTATTNAAVSSGPAATATSPPSFPSPSLSPQADVVDDDEMEGGTVEGVAMATSRTAASVSITPSTSTATTCATTTTTTTTTSVTTTTSTNQRKQKAFLARSLASRTVSFVESELEALTSQCRFLQNNDNNDSKNLHHNHEKNDENDTINNNSSSTSSSSSNIHHQQHQVHNRVARIDRSQVVVGNLLGVGGFSHVYEVQRLDYTCKDGGHEDQRSNNDDDEEATSVLRHAPPSSLVIKHLRPELLLFQQPQTKRRSSKFHAAAVDLAWEAQCLAVLDHPHIVKLRGVARAGISSYRDGRHDGYFLILDRLDETLTHRLDRWRQRTVVVHNNNNNNSGGGDNTTTTTPSSSSPPSFSEVPPTSLDRVEEKLELASQVASALQYLHEHNIVYRDLKPSNIGLRRVISSSKPSGASSVSACLIDFGLCRELPFREANDDGTDKKEELFFMSMVGTRRYMAPEVAFGEGYNLQADVYSFSLVFYEMMTLLTPFAKYGSDLHEWLAMQDNVRPAISPAWSSEVRALFEHGWARRPSDRPTMTEVVKQLENLAGAQRIRNAHIMSSIPVTTNCNTKRKHQLPRKVWFQSGLLEGLPNLFRKASSMSSNCCTSTTATASFSLSRRVSDEMSIVAGGNDRGEAG